MATTPQLSDNALTILQTRYLLVGETPSDLYWRVARAVAAPEGRDADAWAARFYDLMAAGLFLPNSPTLFNAGTGAGTLSACFVIPIEDTMESIMAAATTSALIQKYGGGTGYSFGRLRSKGMPIASTHGKACGAIAVLKMLSQVSEMITQGGKRAGANMGILPVSHPEVLDFIRLKDDFVTAQNFNVSVAVTGAFMQAVEHDTEWALADPHTGAVTQRLPARGIWQAIVDSAWRTGDPGLYFIDQAERRNPTPHLGSLEATNPCGEVPLLPYEACNLGSINLARFVITPAEGRPGSFDMPALEAVVRTAVRFLDNVITINEFPDARVQAAVHATRKIGLGVMGWHDALVRLRVPYADSRARGLADQVMRRINETARAASADLAAERGPYPACQGEPLRNATRTCIAPTGTISAIAGCSSGIEPVFALAYVKHVLDGRHLRESNPYLEQVARERGFWTDALADEVVRTGTLRGSANAPDDVKRLFATALEVPYQAHVAMQSVFQRHTDLAVSKTINLPHTATPADIEEAYWLAYRSGCTGITVYRDGSKPVQVLEVPAGGGERPAPRAPRVKRERPRTIRGVTDRVRTAQGNAYVTVNFDDAGDPFEVFTTIGKAGGSDQANLEAISRLVSLALRSGVPAVEIVEQLRGITSEPVWDSGRLITSPPDAVAQVLAAHALGDAAAEAAAQTAFAAQPALPLGAPAGPQRPDDFADPLLLARGQRCPDCNGPLVMQEGCIACPACGWNKCG